MSNNPCLAQQMAASSAEQMDEYMVTEAVVLAGQPQPEDWARLAGRGFGLIINIRSDPDRAIAQARVAEAAGLRYVHLTLPAYELEPEHLALFNEALTQANGTKMLLHCRTASRTALLWMLHRVVNEGWSQERAEAELRAAGYDDDSMETFCFCAEDFFERTEAAPAALPQER